MPIEMTDYTTGIKAALKKGGYACVYVASTADGRPSRVGYTTDLPAAVKQLARTSPVPIVVEDAMWVPDRGIATNIAQSVLASIAPHRKDGGWHDLAAESVSSAVNLETFRLYPGAAAVPHDRLIAQWGRRSLVPG